MSEEVERTRRYIPLTPEAAKAKENRYRSMHGLDTLAGWTAFIALVAGGYFATHLLDGVIYGWIPPILFIIWLLGSIVGGFATTMLVDHWFSERPFRRAVDAGDLVYPLPNDAAAWNKLVMATLGVNPDQVPVAAFINQGELLRYIHGLDRDVARNLITAHEREVHVATAMRDWLPIVDRKVTEQRFIESNPPPRPE